MINVSTYTNVATSLLRVYQGYTKGIRFLLVMFLTLTVSANVWGATYNFSNIPTSGWKTNGGSQTINGKSWTYSSATYVGCSDKAKIQIGSKNNPQTSNWTIQIPISSFGANIKVTKVAITAYTTATTATYDISVNGSSVKSGNLTTSSATYSSNTLNATTGSIVVTLKGSSSSKAMYLSDIAVTYETAAAATYKVTYNANGATSGTVPTDATSYTSGTTVTVKSNSGNLAKTGYTFGGWNTKSDGTGTNYTAGSGTFTITANTTLYAKWNTATKYTVTLDAGSGTCAESVTEPNAGEGVTLPTPTLDCGDWEFAGWKTTSAVTTKTTTKPTLIPAGNYKPTANTTLYAVYQRTETTNGGGNSVSESITIVPNTFPDKGTSSYASGAERTGAVNEISLGGHYITGNQNNTPTGSTAGKYLQCQAKNATIYNKTKLPGNITKVVINQYDAKAFSLYCGSEQLMASNNTSTEQTPSGTKINDVTAATKMTWDVSGDYTYFALKKGSNTGYVTSIVITYTTSGGTITTTYYHSTPDCGTPPPTPTLNVDPATLTFEKTTTNTSTQKTFTLTGSNLTANASLQLSGINPGMFSLSSNSVTQSAGSINQTITVTYTPTATGSHNATLTISSTGAESKTVTLSGTGVAPAAKYTVTFNAGSGTCGTESLAEESAGAGVTLPTANPPATCATDGWKFAGWWTGSVAETTTSPGELLTAGSTYKPTSDCILYAVYSITESNGGGGSSEITLLPSSFPDKGTNAYDSGAERTATVNDIEFGGHHITGNVSNTPSDATKNQYLQCRASDATIYNKTELPGKITQIVVNQYDAKAFSLYCGSTQLMASDNVDRAQTPSGTKITDVSAATTMTWDVDGNYTFFALKKESYAGYVKSIVITYSGGGSTTTYNSNPVCVASWSITYDFAGGTGSHCSNTSVPQGNTYTICDEAPTKTGNTFLHWSDGTSTYAAGATITPTSDVTLTAVWQANTYTVTWNNNGVTTPIEYNHGKTLEVPAAPASCDGVKEFVGWTALQADYYHATDAPSDIFTTTSSTVTANATYYAVFATPPSSGGAGSVTTVEDKLTRETTGISSGAGYGTWSDKKVNSAAVYAGQSAGGNDAIQIRSDKSTSGIVTTTSGGKVTHVEVDWESNTASDRTLDIYGRNVAYSDATDLYSTSTQGTKLGSIVHGTSTEFEVTGNYEYIGLRSKSGAMYLTSVTITWSSAGGSSSYTDYTTICQEVTGIAISGSYPTTFVQYDSFSFAGGIVTATFENGTTQDVTSLATFSGYNMDEVGVQTVTVTYMGQTAKYEITINQSDRWRLTWNVSGKTNTGARPIYVQKGSAIGTLPVPEVPAACAGKTFMGWTESNVVPSDGKGIVYITEETVPTKNTTYYAVFATINNFSTQAAIEDIKSGSKVVIVAVASMDASGGAGQAISSRTISITSKGIIGLSGDEVSIFDETINTPHSTCIWTLTKEGGGIVFEQGEKYIRAVDNGYRRLLLETTKDYWTLSPVTGKDKTYHMQSGNTSHYVEWFDHTDSKYDEGERYIGFIPYTTANNYGDFDMQFYVTANADGNADITDYTTGCAEYTITYYGFRGGYSTSSSSDGTIVLPVNSLHTVPDCGDVVKDHTNLGREFLNVWMTKPHGGHTFKPGDTFILTQDTTLYAQWKLETNSDLTTLPTDIEDLAGTDVYVYGGKTLNIQPGTTTINSLTLKGGIQTDGSYQMPSVWVPEGATLVRNSNKIYLDLVVNAKTWYPFAVPFETKNTSDIHYLHPDMKSAAKYSQHFDIKTYDGARRADVGEDKANNWVRLKRHTAEEPVSFKPGVGYIISAMAYPGTDTATIRIPMSVPNTWFKNGEQAVVGTTVRNTIAVTAHGGAAASEHQRHAGWNFVANPYLSYFTGGGIDATNGLDYIDGELIIQGGYEYSEETVPYVTIPAYNFAYYSQHKLSDVKLSPEYSFFVQIGTSGTMNFTTEGRQQAPAALRSNMDNPRIETDIVISHNQQTADHTGLIIDDRYTTAYEIGADLEKMFGSAYNTTIYTLGNDVRLAYNALSHIEATIPIPLGFRAETDGEYTISLTNPEDILTVESIVLQDSYNNTTTNLLLNDYTFYTDRTQDDQRFVVYIVPHNNAPTDISTIIDNDTETRRVIHNHRLYIIHNGHVYDGVGQTIQ